jgi:hypothetical protein
MTSAKICRSVLAATPVVWKDEWFKVYCFKESEHADLFRARFGGETFDPKQRGKGARWARWMK